MRNVAKELLKLLESKDYGMRFRCEDMKKSYNASEMYDYLREIEEGTLIVTNQTGKTIGTVFLMYPGPNSCSEDESIVDYVCDTPLAKMIEELENENN
jgi:hypothetical protein